MPVEDNDSAEVPAQDEDVTEAPVEGDDSAEVPAQDEDVTEAPVEDDDSAEEPVNEAVQTTVWDKLVGYYQQVTTAYSSLLSSLKK